jgi:hypothetical protein
VLSHARVLRVFKYAMFFDGIDDYVVISLTVYGWSGITIQEWIYPFHPKPNVWWSKTGMIGDFWTDRPSTYYTTDNRHDYTVLNSAFRTRRPDGTHSVYAFSIYAYRNTWVNVARRFSLADRMFIGYVNGSRVYTATIPPTEATILEWNPDRATYPWMYRRFVLGANVYGAGAGAENMMMMQYQLLIYTRDISSSDIEWNFRHPDNPVRDDLYVWLQADPAHIKDIDGDGVLEWIDLSGNGNHGKIYGATLVELVKSPARAPAPARLLAPVR